MRRYLPLLIVLLLLTGVSPGTAQEALYGRILAIDSSNGQATLETLPTLFQPERKQVSIDLSTLDREQWSRLDTGDTIRVWVPAGTGDTSFAGVRALQVHSSKGQRQTDPTGVRQRLNSPNSGGSRAGSGSSHHSGGRR